jgi:hypothetical protein
LEAFDERTEMPKPDLCLFALGFEERCTFLAQRSRIRGGAAYAIGYSYNQNLGYKKSKARFERAGVEVIDNVSDADYSSVILRLLQSHPECKEILIDISSLNRGRIAALIEALMRNPGRHNVTASFCYCPAKFQRPRRALTQNETIGPVNVAFSGMLSDPEMPAEVIVGLGYENGKALGAVEFLQCNDVWTLIPTSREPRFEFEVERVNATLLSQSLGGRVLRYRVEDPVGTFSDLCSLVDAIRERSKPVLLPLGPKVFALICFLVGYRYPDVSVWRASQGSFEVPSSRIAQGHVVGVRTRFS